jgi:hypothetical protein
MVLSHLYHLKEKDTVLKWSSGIKESHGENDGEDDKKGHGTDPLGKG